MTARLFILGVTTALLLTPASVAVSTQGAQHLGHNRGRSGGPLVDAVREATEKYRDADDAVAAGYSPMPTCVSGPEEGAMGVHFANGALFDDKIEVDKPEVLVYEPKNGRLHLVAAEYITPAPAWDPAHSPARPDLMGHLLHFVSGPNRYGPDAFYELHVWAWKNNPRGNFSDWNPNVSCADWEGPVEPRE